MTHVGFLLFRFENCCYSLNVSLFVASMHAPVCCLMFVPCCVTFSGGFIAVRVLLFVSLPVSSFSVSLF
jgi:hypothetical protein